MIGIEDFKLKTLGQQAKEINRQLHPFRLLTIGKCEACRQ